MNEKINENKVNRILGELESYKKKDFTFSDGHILGSMCNQPHPIAVNAYTTFLETNLGDPALFPGTKKIEEKLLLFIKDLLHTPSSGQGHIVSGGTEGNISAMWIAKQLTHKKEIIVPASAHFSFQKIASLMDMNIKSIPLTRDYTVDLSKLRKEISSETAAVLGIAGSTDLGVIDPIQEIGEICGEEHIFFHVDAAYGGFIIPFLQSLGYDLSRFDFTVNGVSSICLDAHKMGYAAIPLGTLVIRDSSWLDEISVESRCVSSEKQPGILGTRSGGPVAAAYAVTQYLGKKGYQQIMQQCMNLTDYTKKRIQEIGLPLVYEHPPLNILAIKLQNVDDIDEKLTQKGWKVNKMNHLSAIRLVLKPNITKSIIDEFIPQLQKTCEDVGEL